MTQPQLLIEPISPLFVTPTRGTRESAGLDFYALTPGSATPGAIHTISLGCKIAFPPGYALLLSARSSHGRNYGAGVPHGFGLIDADFRGELVYVMRAQRPFNWAAGERICQGTLVPVAYPEILLVEKVPPSERGEGGFGSTGK